MRDRFWLLPGPRRLLGQIRDLLLGGESVVLLVPPWAPELVEALFVMLPPHRAIHDLAEVTADAGAPEALLRETLGLSPEQSLDGCAEVHAEPIIVVRASTENVSRVWVRFFKRHYHATRTKGGAPRLLLVLDAACPAEAAAIGAAPVLQWRDPVTRLDMHLYSAELWSHRDLSALERELCVVLTREIAAWCPELAERLAEAGPEAAFNPLPLLLRMAGDRTWEGRTLCRWELGSQHRRDGIVLSHAALLAACGDGREIRRRIWRAQVEVLFPVVEQIRAELAARYAPLLVGVCDAVTGLACDPLDVDIGPLASRLVNAAGVSGVHRRLAAAIRDVRRPLAHLEPVSRATALQRPLVDAMASGFAI
jgi:hypothetical protein